MSRHILVVDDDEETLELLKAFLSQAGYQISVARNSEEMDQVMAKWSIDLLVLDLMLKNQSGLDICRDLRQTSSVPVLMLTAMSADQDRIKGLELGADDYMTKPFDPIIFDKKINEIINGDI